MIADWDLGSVNFPYQGHTTKRNRMEGEHKPHFLKRYTYKKQFERKKAKEPQSRSWITTCCSPPRGVTKNSQVQSLQCEKKGGEVLTKPIQSTFENRTVKVQDGGIPEKGNRSACPRGKGRGEGNSSQR